MSKILLAGKPDDTLNRLNKKLSAHYTVRFGSSVPFAVCAAAESFKPDLAVIKLSDADDTLFADIRKTCPGVKIVAVGTPGEAMSYPELRADAICEYTVEALYGAVTRLMPLTADESTARRTVMVIDDDAATLRMVKLMIEADYGVLPAPSGAKALAMLENRRPDVILLDYEMPGMNGMETFERLRAAEWFANIPVVFLTGAVTSDVTDRIEASGAAGCLIKPADAPDIKAAIKAALAR